MVLKDFNLLVTTARGNEEDACSEIWYLLGEIGDPRAIEPLTELLNDPGPLVREAAAKALEKIRGSLTTT